MDVSTMEILIVGVLLFTASYYYLIKPYNFWISRNVFGPKPSIIFGNMKDVILGEYSFVSFMNKVQEQYPDAPMIGIYFWRQPLLIINDEELIKNVLIKDFETFMDRGLEINEKHDPLSLDLSSLDPERWRLLRTKLTPVFTPTKIREMFYLLIECANQLDNYLNRLDNKSVDMREVAVKFNIDVLCVCAFGLQANALGDEGCIPREMGRRMVNSSLKNALKVRVRDFAPRLYNLIGGFLVDHDVTNFFLRLTRDTVEYRKKNNVNRHDFIDLLMAVREDCKKAGGIELTDSLMAAQLFVFFFAGFEPAASTMSNCLYELAQNHKIQDKLRKEIKDELSITSGEMTYDVIQNMKYLDKVVNETVRKYPAVPLLMRKSSAPYTFPGTDVTIPVGTKVVIPTLAIHRNPKKYQNPNNFDPERFNGVGAGGHSNMSFLSFGKGPRNCIGAHFGRMQSKVGIVKVLQNHIVDVCDETDLDYEIAKKHILLTPKNGIVLKIMKQQI